MRPTTIRKPVRTAGFRLLLSGLLLLSVTLSACGPTETPIVTPPATAEATPVPTAEPTDEPPLECSDFSEGFLEAHPREALFVTDQVILTGSGEAIDQVLNQITQELGIETDLIASFELVGAEVESLLVYPAWMGSDLSVQLRAFSGDVSVERLVCELTMAGADLDVAADPNYFVSPAQWSIEGFPWSEGGGWGTGVQGGGFEEAQPDQFLSQWALGGAGLNLLDVEARLVDQTGEGVRVGVFDTSPFALASGPDDTFTIDWIDPQMDLRVIHPSTVSGYSAPAKAQGGGVRNHGLFVAGLVHIMAPGSTIHLYRVLEDDGRGSLFDLSLALHTFTAEVEQDRQSSQLGQAPAVANLSLGAHQPKAMVEHGLRAQIAPLQLVLAEAISAGIVVVAAAGNDSAPSATTSAGCDENPVHCAQVPALLDPVVGVAASNHTGARSCYSNRGDVAAPGGDGVGTGCTVPPSCSAAPELCLVGLSMDAATGYVYWAGTSFATPLVSGLAALLLQSGVAPADVPAGIYGTATAGDPDLGEGIVTLP